MSLEKINDPLDPKGLIRESFRMEGLEVGEARSIFLDWALSLPASESQQQAAATLLSRYGAGHENHPMWPVLNDATRPPEKAKRRGGWRARRSDLD
ncbi:hypothetical protein TL5118_03523 [Thalassovita autumnalis]|uniref:Uncharacterized protein n=1 Tax=Thalassovita autumnalis TaxID=2072972 RepID=A0A0P1FMJ7_9RHOB|nr:MULTISPECIES: hypothetical protein [Thalassovita]CUH69558.1 hypothetical protein TL5118_03523 [Thalassovita autumnalis]CUH72961.1 hypothetical protein TL5120_02763 [Thalassovita autumnalis]